MHVELTTGVAMVAAFIGCDENSLVPPEGRLRAVLFDTLSESREPFFSADVDSLDQVDEKLGGYAVGVDTWVTDCQTTAKLYVFDSAGNRVFEKGSW